MRLLVHVEGETEETFVNEVLAPYLYTKGYSQVGARLLGNSRQRAKRGGIRSWSSVRADIIAHLKQDAGCVATTMVDYYALPQSGGEAWPGRSASPQQAFATRASSVEGALAADLIGAFGSYINPNRFVPFVLMHEFEALLFSDCARFAESIARPELAEAFQAIRSDFESPEHINDSPLTAPSKRIEALLPGYQKPLYGNIAALDVGLHAMTAECHNFRRWLGSLERVAAEA